MLQYSFLLLSIVLMSMSMASAQELPVPGIRNKQKLTILSANDGQIHRRANPDAKADKKLLTPDSITVIHLGPDHPPIVKTVYGTVPNTIAGAPYMAITSDGHYGFVTSRSGPHDPDDLHSRDSTVNTRRGSLLLAILGTSLPFFPPALAVAQKEGDALEFQGSLAAVHQVELKPRVSTVITKIHFQDGDAVKKGDVLVELDARPFLARLDRAKAGVVQAQAQQKLAKADAARLQQLVAKGATTREELDKATLQADVAEAGLLMARADLELAELNVAWTRVLAPIDGRVGQALIREGNFARADEDALAAITSLDPLHVVFHADERASLKLAELVGKSANVRDAKVPVQVGLVSEKGFPHQGVLDFIDNQFDAKKGTVTVRGVLKNPNGLLRPGMPVRVRVPAR